MSCIQNQRRAYRSKMLTKKKKKVKSKMNWKYINPLFWIELIVSLMIIEGANQMARRVVNEVRYQNGV